MKNLREQTGFTLVEIAIAMSVFSVSLVILTVSFIGLVRTQRQAADDRATQQNARSITEDIVKDIRASRGALVCTVNGKEALLLDKATPLLYFVSPSGEMKRGDVASAASCPAGSSNSEILTSRRVQVSALNFVVIADAPATGTVKSVAVDIAIEFKAGDDENAPRTSMRTIGATREGL